MHGHVAATAAGSGASSGSGKFSAGSTSVAWYFLNFVSVHHPSFSLIGAANFVRDWPQLSEDLEGTFV